MAEGMVISLINNLALLMALGIVYEVSYSLPNQWHRLALGVKGILIGLICLAIMFVPFQFATGIVFDTRSILLCVSAFVFGPIPSIIAGVIGIVYRVIQGGVGMLTGVSVIVASVGLGLLWRSYGSRWFPKNQWLRIYVLGLVVHLAMLACMFLLPFDTAIVVTKAILIPVLVIYPLGTVFLSVLLLHQRERNEAMNQVVEAEGRYRNLFENSQTVKYLLDPETGKIIDANPAAAEFYGFSVEELKTMNVSDINTLSLAEIREELELAANGTRNNFHFSHRAAGGRIADVEIYSGPIQLRGETLLYSTVHDITERVEMERVRAEMEAQQRQRQKLEAIGTLASGVAHEINNPISGIMNYAQLILDYADLESDQATYANEIMHESERIAVIVRNLLQFSRQEKQSHSYASIYDIVDQTVSLIRTIIKKDQIELEIDMEENLPMIKCRSQQLQQVIMNLLTNARDALNQKFEGYDQNKRIRLSARQYKVNDKRWIKITVEDKGVGIPEEIRDKVFEPFFSTKPKELGTGLGLSISFGIVNDHHGNLAIESVEGEYTRFILDLPVDNGWELEKEE